MKKIDNFYRCLNVLKKSNVKTAEKDEIYRMGVIGQFNLCFELAWKALQSVLQLHSVKEAATGSPREIIKAAFKVNFISNEPVWLDMLDKRNLTIHEYNEDEAITIINLIYTSFIPELEILYRTLVKKTEETV